MLRRAEVSSSVRWMCARDQDFATICCAAEGMRVAAAAPVATIVRIVGIVVPELVRSAVTFLVLGSWISSVIQPRFLPRMNLTPLAAAALYTASRALEAWA